MSFQRKSNCHICVNQREMWLMHLKYSPNTLAGKELGTDISKKKYERG
nr:MAG TPA: hypothetical protein [Caudoviricetes sp.]